MTQETKNKMAEIMAAAQKTQLKQSTIVKVEAKDELKSVEVKQEDPKQTKNLTLKSFKIVWHEGKRTPDYTNASFNNWLDVQNAFFNIWDANERGEDGGYTKVKIEMCFNEMEAPAVDRIDVTNGENNGDFNPSLQKVWDYIQQIMCEPHETILFDEAAEIVKQEVSSLNIEEVTIEELIKTESSKEDSCLTEELSTLTIGDILGETREKAPTQLKKIIELIEYNANSFALVGEGTREHKEKIKDLGGKFNRFLKCGAGWIFSNKQREKVNQFLNTL